MKKINLSLARITTILNGSDYIDGSTLGRSLKITRSAVWKVIQKLESYGIHVESIKGKGYKLLEPLILLDKTLIKKRLALPDVAIEVLEAVDSTNTYLRNLKKAKGTYICLAETQLAGKGRLTRTWHSPFGKNIYLSCFYTFQKDISSLSGLSLVVALATLKTLKQYGEELPFFVKWPNDIIYQGKKVSGNLIEVQAETNSVCHAIIGVGINVNMRQKDNRTISQPWTSLQEIVNRYIDRNKFATILISNLLTYLQKFASLSFSAFQKEWEQSDHLKGKSITLYNLEKEIKGTARGVDKNGHLILIDNKKMEHSFSAGDVSLSKSAARS